MAQKVNSSAMAACKALGWDEFATGVKGVNRAIKTVQGIPFAFTSEIDLVFMSDNDSIYTVSELAGCFKRYGNYSDFADSRKITTVINCELVKAELEDIRQAIINVPNKFGSLPANIVAELKSKDWAAIADELLPYAKAIQDVVEIVNMKM